MMPQVVILSAFILVLITALPVMAAYDQSGFPAKCWIYSVCDDDTCLRPISFGEIVIKRENVGFKIEGLSSGRPSLLHIYENLAQANATVSKNASFISGIIAIPNDEVADAFGLNLHPIYNSGSGSAHVYATATKVACSRIEGGLN